MNITFVAPPPNMSGGIRVIAIYARWLQRHGHRVTIVHPRPAPPRPRPLGRIWQALRGQQARAAPAQPSHFDSLDVQRIELDGARPVEDRDVPDGDVVIATWWETAEWVSRLSIAKGRKFYFVQHHETFDYLPVQRVEATYRLPLKKIVIARWLQELMLERYGDPNTLLVPNAVDHAQFHAPPRGKQPLPTIGVLFHETPFKGFDTALQVIEKVRNRRPDLRVVAFGTDPPKQYAPLPQGFSLHVAPAQTAIRDLYAQCDAWLTCSRSEGFNLPAMEAMACRTPVVATRTGWPAEAIRDGVNGYLAEVDDVEALAQGLLALLTLDPSDWRQVSDNAFDTVADCSWEHSSRAFEAALSA
ncbi:MAG: glycosyltransferase family 4 protein [Burkholderiales bacterium]